MRVKSPVHKPGVAHHVRQQISESVFLAPVFDPLVPELAAGLDLVDYAAAVGLVGQLDGTNRTTGSLEGQWTIVKRVENLRNKPLRQVVQHLHDIYDRDLRCSLGDMWQRLISGRFGTDDTRMQADLKQQVEASHARMLDSQQPVVRFQLSYLGHVNPMW